MLKHEPAMTGLTEKLIVPPKKDDNPNKSTIKTEAKK
jgi:hypothetical protein